MRAKKHENNSNDCIICIKVSIYYNINVEKMAILLTFEEWYVIVTSGCEDSTLIFEMRYFKYGNF